VGVLGRVCRYAFADIPRRVPTHPSTTPDAANSQQHVNDHTAKAQNFGISLG